MKPAPTDPQTGSQIARYRARPIRGAEFLRLAILGAAAVLGPLFFGLYLYSNSVPRYGVVAAERWSRPWLALSLAGMGVFLLLCVIRLAASRRAVEVYQKGLRIKLGRTVFIPWNQLAGVSTEINALQAVPGRERLQRRAVLHPSTGQPIRLGQEFENLPELLSHIKAHLYPRLLPALREEFHSGRWVHFGELAISSQGLRVRPEGRSGSDHRRRLDMTWPQVESVQVQNGRLILEYCQAGEQTGAQPNHTPANPSVRRQRRLEAGQIPNIELLLQLIQQEVTP
jgi:hypothetical protein